jgi:hypothetical protein
MSTVHHQEYLITVYTQQVFVMLVLLASASRQPTELAWQMPMACVQCWDIPDDGQWTFPKHVEYFIKQIWEIVHLVGFHYKKWCRVCSTLSALTAVKTPWWWHVWSAETCRRRFCASVVYCIHSSACKLISTLCTVHTILKHKRRPFIQ